MSQMERKHIEYLGIVKQHFGPGSIQNASIMHQIKIDVPRTAPSTPLFREALVRESLERILYCVSIRRPASSYVQGMNDLLTPIYSVLFSEYLFELAGGFLFYL